MAVRSTMMMNHAKNVNLIWLCWLVKEPAPPAIRCAPMEGSAWKKNA